MSPRRISTRKASSRVSGGGIRQPNPFLKCTAPDHKELYLKPPTSSNLPPPPQNIDPESGPATIQISMPFEAKTALTMNENNEWELKMVDGAYVVAVPNYSVEIRLSDNVELAHQLGMDTSQSLAVAVPEGCAATWNPDYKNDASYDSVYTINNPSGSNHDGAWMIYAPLQLPETRTPADKPKTINNLPAVTRAIVNGEEVLKFRIQVPITYPLPQSQGGGFVDIQAKLNELEPGQKLQLNMLFPAGVPVTQQRTIGLQLDKKQGPGTFVEFQMPAALWDDEERRRIANKGDTRKSLEDIAVLAVATTVVVTFVWNAGVIYNIIKLLGSIIYKYLRVGFRPAKRFLLRYGIYPRVPTEVPSFKGVLATLQDWDKRQCWPPPELDPGNIDMLEKMPRKQQQLLFSVDERIPGTDVTGIQKSFTSLPHLTEKQCVEGLKDATRNQIARDNPVIFTFMGSHAEPPWTWGPDQLEEMIRSLGAEDAEGIEGATQRLMICIKANPSMKKEGISEALDKSYAEAVTRLKEKYKSGPYHELTEDPEELKGWLDHANENAEFKGLIEAAAEAGSGDVEKVVEKAAMEGVARLSSPRRISPRLVRLMKRYRTIQQGL